MIFSQGQVAAYYNPHCLRPYAASGRMLPQAVCCLRLLLPQAVAASGCCCLRLYAASGCCCLRLLLPQAVAASGCMLPQAVCCLRLYAASGCCCLRLCAVYVSFVLRLVITGIGFPLVWFLKQQQSTQVKQCSRYKQAKTTYSRGSGGYIIVISHN